MRKILLIIALLIFTLASLTDLYDGYIARRLNQVTDLGKLIDPIADKVLIFSCFLAFLDMGLIRAWMVIIILFREIVITAFRLYALTKKQVIQADIIGKHKLVSQVVAIYCILLSLIIRNFLVLPMINFQFSTRHGARCHIENKRNFFAARCGNRNGICSQKCIFSISRHNQRERICHGKTQ